MSLNKISEFCDRITEYFAIAVGWLLVFLILYISIDVVGRKLFNVSIQGSDEIGGYIMSVLSAVGFSYALSKTGHVRLMLLLSKMPTVLKAFMNLFAYTILMVYSYMMTWQVLTVLMDSFQLKAKAPTTLEIPLMFPQSILTLALTWFSVNITIYLFRLIVLIYRKEFSESLLQEGEV